MVSIHPVVRRVATAALLATLVVCDFLPMERSAAAQSGRKIPEKARKTQAEDTSGQPKDNPSANPSGPKPPPLRPEDLQSSIQLGVNIVNVETVVYEKKSGKILQGLKPENFAIFEDGVKQDITNFTPSEGPITMVFVLEFSKRIDNYYFRKTEVLDPAAYFVTTVVKPGDNIA